MDKSELVERIAKDTQLTKAAINDVINSMTDQIRRAVRKGDDVTLAGFGTFTKSKRKARKGRNPQTGEEMRIPALTLPKFRPGKEFRNMVQ